MPAPKEYSQVSAATISAPRNHSIFGPRVQMFSFLVAGATIAALHIAFYAYLSGKSVTSASILRTQSIASAIGNACAYLAKTSLAGAIGIVFVQQFWFRLRERGGTIGEIDAIMNSKDHPMTPASLPALRHAVGLFILALLGSATALISVFAPGTLNVELVDFYIRTPCTGNSLTVPNASQVEVHTWAWMVSRVIEQGTHFPPPDPCSGIACRYAISYNAPALACSNITSTYNFTPFTSSPPPLIAETFTGLLDLFPDIADPNGGLGRQWLDAPTPYYIYHANWTDYTLENFLNGFRNNTFSIRVVWTNGTDQLMEALQCDAYLASYAMTVTHSGNGTVPTVEVTDQSFVAEFQHAVDAEYQSGMLLLATMLLESVQADLWIDIAGSVIQLPPQFNGTVFKETPLIHSPMFEPVNGTWGFSTKPGLGLPSLMQNVSISLLSNDVWTFAGTNYSSRQPLNATCHYSSPIYVFAKRRLIATYAVALAITVLCISVGERAIRRNGIEERIEFSRLLNSLVNTKLYEARQQMELSMDSRLQADRDTEGMLKPVSN